MLVSTSLNNDKSAMLVTHIHPGRGGGVEFFCNAKTFLAAGQASLTLYESAGSLFSLEFSRGYEARRLIAR